MMPDPALTARVRDAVEAKAAALVARDATRLTALLHPGFVYTNAAGHRFDRAGYVEAYCISGRVVFREQRTSALEVAGFGGYAVATMELDDRFEAGGALREGRYRALSVFDLADGACLWAAGQTMPR